MGHTPHDGLGARELRLWPQVDPDPCGSRPVWIHARVDPYASRSMRESIRALVTSGRGIVSPRDQFAAGSVCRGISLPRDQSCGISLPRDQSCGRTGGGVIDDTSSLDLRAYFSLVALRQRGEEE